jgi:hypothetical protein
MPVLSEAAFAWNPHPSWDPHPNPPPFRGRELTELAAPAWCQDRESGAAIAFLPLKGGGSRWGSPPSNDAVDAERDQGGAH